MSETTDKIMQKKRIREKIRKCLRAMPQQARDSKSEKACRNLVLTEQFQQAEVIMMYLAMPYELDVTGAMEIAWEHGKTVVVPKINWQKKHMVPVRINSLREDFSTEAYGLRNPINATETPCSNIDLVVTPAMAYDKKGNRLGRGGSYYDRFFADKNVRAHRCGFAFEEQFLESVPICDYDQPIDSLVTDEQTINFGENRP